MYERFFQFQTSPFPAAPSVANYFPAQAIATARQSLIRIIERAEGPALIVGPAGVGKSLLLRVLADYFEGVFRIAYLSGTRVDTRRSLLQNVLFELGLSYRGLDEGELRLALIDALRPSDACPNGILLLVDEAHTLPLRLLDELRMITNVVRDGQPRAHLVLAGGPPLEERFANPKLESFNQRIAARCYLQPFNRDETYEFLRAQVSGAGGDPDAIFSEEAVRAVQQAADGIPRLINQICDHALIMAHAAGQHRLDAATIQESWADLQQLLPPWQEPPAESSSAKNMIIEFGQLDEDEPPPAGATVEFHAAEDEHTSPASECLPPTNEDAHPTTFVGLSNQDIVGEWMDVVEATREAPAPSLATNPFEDQFEEEIVVIDRDTAWEIEAFRGRPRVSCAEGRHLVAELNALLATEGPVDSISLSSLDSEVPVATPPAFEFTTLQTVDASAAFPALYTIEQKPMSDSAAESETDFDEEVDCVPLPWTRGGLSDDRDMIVVEEDMPSLNLVPADVPAEGRPRRMEYRELFAQLRRASR